MYRFKAKESEIKPGPLCIGKIFSVKYFEILPRHNEYEKRELKGSVKVFFIDYNAINTSNTLDNSYNIAQARTVNASNHTKCVSVNSQQCMTQRTLN